MSLSVRKKLSREIINSFLKKALALGQATIVMLLTKLYLNLML